jgi:CRP-like cAMP-binding protein
MIQQIHHVDHFKQQLRQSLQQEARPCRTVQFAKHTNIYTYGDQDETVYFIESGQVKLLMLSTEGFVQYLAVRIADQQAVVVDSSKANPNG